MAKLYNDNIKEQIDDLFAPDVKEELLPESPTLIAEEKKEPVKLDSNIGEMVHDLFESVDVVIPEVEILEVAEPVAKKKPTKEAKNYEGPLYAPWSDVVKGRAKSKSSLKESKVSNSTFVDDVASKMSQVQKRTNQASGQERLTEEQLTLNNFQVQIDGIRRALREHTVVSGIGQGGDGQTPGSGVVRIRDLDDVNLDNISNGDSLIWDDLLGSFVPGAGGPGGGGGVGRLVAGKGIDLDPPGGIGVVEIAANLDLVDLDDVIGSPSDGDLLIYNGSNWSIGSLNTSELQLKNPQGSNPFNLARYSRYDVVADGVYITQEDANILFANLIDDLDSRIEELEPDPTDPDANKIGDLDDVSVAGANTGDFLVYDDSEEEWNATTVPIPNVTVSDNSPNTGGEQQGDFWYKTDTEELYIYNTVWTEISSSGGTTVELSDNPPSGNNETGNLWVDTTDWSLYVYDGFNWVGLTNQGLTGGDNSGETQLYVDGYDPGGGGNATSMSAFKQELLQAVNDSTDYESLKAALITALS